MEKTQLDCYVTGCVYNADRYCCKGDIVVGGKEARENKETVCESFRERGSEQLKNVVDGTSKNIAIVCEATNCRFNEEKNCKAEHISIAGGGACTCGETECASFECNC